MIQYFFFFVVQMFLVLIIGHSLSWFLSPIDMSTYFDCLLDVHVGIIIFLFSSPKDAPSWAYVFLASYKAISQKRPDFFC